MDPTTRFSSRVADYIRYRPGYPEAVLDTLQAECGLTSDAVIADVGSGTGILTEMFLRRGNRVHAVEPNREMRLAAEGHLSRYPALRSVDARAEATTLPAGSVDVITAGQAFHWFDRAAARAEFIRILAPEGWVVILWNERDDRATPFLVGYEALLHAHATDYAQVDHRRMDDAVMNEFFCDPTLRKAIWRHRQICDYDGLKGRLLSSSYVPDETGPGYWPMLDALERLFDRHAEGGVVAFEYDAIMYYGRLR